MGDSLGDRMKQHESVSRFFLTRRLPLIIRVDGKAFHSFTARGFDKPWDKWVVSTMLKVAKALCEEVAGCQLAYWQSDEISLLVRDDMSLQTQPWFDKNVSKVVSVSAGVASAVMSYEYTAGTGSVVHTYKHLPIFDSRAFVLPETEVANYMIWRQQDAVRNSIQALGHAHFSDRELHRLNCDQIQEKLFQEKGINWNDTPTHLKRGACVKRVVFEVPGQDGQMVTRHRWEADMEMPILTQDRAYIEQHLRQE